MRQLKKIIVGYDFRPGGDIAARCAVELATRCAAEVKLVYVLEPLSLSQRLSSPLTTPYSAEELTERAGERLRALVATTNYSALHADYEVRAGKPFLELILARRAWQADLIIVGGHHAQQSQSLGTTSEYVVRKAMVPVLVAAAPFGEGAKTILVPTDFSVCAATAAEEAIAFVRHFGGQVIFFHAREPLSAFAYNYDPLFPVPPSLPPFQPEDVEAALAQEWQGFLKDLPSLGAIPWEQYHAEGRPIAAIREAAEQHHVDLIVMGTHGRTGLSQMLLGSVAEGLIRQAPCSVLTVRPEGFQFELP
jgi:nucleotide-binding universal stress UspA family protein